MALLASPAPLTAQFQAPTPDELKMTSDPKAPGAAAVYLYREETTDDVDSVHSYYERIKVLTEKGKELGTVRIPYERGEFKVTKVEGRTIHADGTVIPLAVKPEDIVDFKTKHFQENTIVFTLPSVEVGSILEYRFQLRYGDSRVHAPRWNIQQPYFVHKAHYFFRPNWSYGSYISNDRGQRLDSLMWAIQPADSAIKVQNQKSLFTVDVTDIPPAPDEDWMPPPNALSQRVVFFYTYATTPQFYWDTERRFWNQWVEYFIRPSDVIKAAAAGLVSSGDTDEQKARKIYAAVMKLDNTDFSRVKSEAERKKEKLKEIRTIDDIWKNQSGNGNSMALLYVALARAAGLKAWAAQVVDRSQAVFDQSDLDVGQLTDFIAVVSIGGKDVFVDPEQKVAPFGALHWAHTLSVCFRQSDTGPLQIQTPGSTYKDNALKRTADLTVDAEGNVQGTVHVIMAGAHALYWRHKALENDVEEVKKQFNESLLDDLPDGVETSFDHFVGLDDPESDLMAIISVTGKIGMVTGKRFFLPGLFFESRAKHPFIGQDKRITPIDVQYPAMENDAVTYHLPPGYTVESMPKTSDVNWPGYAALRINSAAKGDAIEVVRVFARNFTLLKPEAYNDLHDFYLKLASADEQQVVLARASTSQGN